MPDDRAAPAGPHGTPLQPGTGLAMGAAAALYPVALVVRDRPCLVVGGGGVAARKVRGLWECGARVTVVAPRIDPAIEALATTGARGSPRAPVALTRRPYRAGEAAGYRLVVTATGRAEVDPLVAADADAAGVWVNSADDAGSCSFLLPSVHRQEPVTVAVSTGGSSPALAAWLRRRIADLVGPEVASMARLLDEERRRLRREGRSTEDVAWDELFDGDFAALVARGDLEGARVVLQSAVGGSPPPPAPGQRA